MVRLSPTSFVKSLSFHLQKFNQIRLSNLQIQEKQDYLSQKDFKTLERLQYRAIRIAMGYRISIPINVMLFEAREVKSNPLKIRFHYLSKYLIN